MNAVCEVVFHDGSGLREVARQSVERGVSVLDAALEAGVEIAATCGRRGRCRSCRVKIISGEVAPPTLQDTLQLGHDGVHERFRLSCQMPVVGPCAVAVMPERGEAGHQILSDAGTFEPGAMELDSGVRKTQIKAQAPQDENHQTSDLEQVLACLPAGTSTQVSLSVARKLPTALRAELGQLTVTTWGTQIIDVEPGNTESHVYGMAFDIGTTSVVGTLHNLQTGESLASSSAVNPQAVFGGDLMSRIAYAQFDDKKLQVLRGRILALINEFIENTCEQAKVDPGHIYKIVIAGNTCMHHLVLGIDTSYVGLAPYAPVVRDPVVVAAADIPLKRVPQAQVCFLPIVAGFVGADTMAGILATRIYDSSKVRLLVDIGTNGEVVLGSRDRLLVCSAPAGPTFEGGQIRHGMRGAIGAIERVTIEEDIKCEVIGGVPAVGICGSGLIDAVAKLRASSVLDEAGRFWRPSRKSGPPPALADRIVPDANARSFVMVRSQEGGRGEDIVLTQGDIRQLQLAKAAIYGGVLMLQQVLGVGDAEIEEVMLSGGFGNYVNVQSAVDIALLPNVDVGRIRYVGNTALLGAQLALMSETERDRTFTIARGIEHVALATRAEFQEIFVQACRLSHELSPGLSGNAE